MKYISLFSSAGIGTFGLKKKGYICLATNELLEERMYFQRLNNVCENADQYITGDITKDETKELIYKKAGKKGELDLIIATPPCQGISLINLKKNNKDNERNSLVVESLEIINKIEPKAFVLENVQRFLQTACLHQGDWKEIRSAIKDELSNKYSIAYKTLNLKHIGSNSSRTRTIVIGVRRDLSTHFSPWELFPNKVDKIPTLHEVIGKYKSLEWGEFDSKDFYHNFRVYDEKMRPWIRDLEPGQSAFDNVEMDKIPHKIIGGEIILNTNSTGDKYKRQFPDKVAQCVMTRNDQLASQNTIHPFDDRVFSIRELMSMMTIPSDFKFFNLSNSDFQKLSSEEKVKYYRKYELNIRRTIGEAVPTFLFEKIASNLEKELNKVKIDSISEVKDFIEKNKIKDNNELVKFVDILSRKTLNLVFEELEPKSKETGLYFTNMDIVTDLINDIEINGSHIVEPSVGLGSFIIPLIKAYPEKELKLTVFDINSDALNILKKIVPKNTKITYMHCDFLSHTDIKADLVIGNPPYVQISKKDREYLINSNAKNLFELFTYKSKEISKEVIFVLPKYILFNSKYSEFRKYMLNNGVYRFWDYKGMLFPNAKIETIALAINSKRNSFFITDGTMFDIKMLTNDRSSIWTIRPNLELINFASKMTFDGNISSLRMLKFNPSYASNDGEIKVITSSNSRGLDKKMFVKKGLFDNEAKMTGILVPNMTKKIRAERKKKNEIWNGSLALINIDKKLENKALKTWNSKQFSDYIDMMRSGAERSINIDKEIIKHFGVLND